jgi:hypothetical protein
VKVKQNSSKIVNVIESNVWQTKDNAINMIKWIQVANVILLLMGKAIENRRKRLDDVISFLEDSILIKRTT